jgi:hypothetical protein
MAGKDRQRGDRRSAAFVQTLLAVNMLDQRAGERAEQLLQEALATYREVGDESDAVGPLLFLGPAAAEQGKSTQGVALLQEGPAVPLTLDSPRNARGTVSAR